MEWYEAGDAPGVRELARELGKIGVLGMHLEGYGCAGMRAVHYGLACLELEARRLRHPLARLGAGQPRDVRDLAVRQRGAEAGVAAAHGRRRGDRLLRPHRARPRLRPRRDAHPRPPRRRRLGAQRLARCGSPTARSPTSRSCGRRRDERRHPRLRRPHRHTGIRRPEIKHKLSLRASVTSELVLDDVRLPADAVLPDVERPQGPARLPHPRALRHRLGRDRRGPVLARGAPAGTRRSASSSAGPSPASSSPRPNSPTWRSSCARGCCSPSTSAAARTPATLRPEQVSFGKLNNVREAIEICRDRAARSSAPTASRWSTR